MKQLFEFVIQQLKLNKKTVFGCLVALLVMSVSQAFLIFLIGPVVKTMFGFSQGESVEHLQFIESIQDYISIYFSSSIKDMIWLVPLVLFCVGLVRTISLFWYSYQVETLVLRIVTNLRVRFFSGFLKLNYLEISKKNHAQWASHIMNDVILFQGLFADFCKVVVRDLTIIFASICILLWVDQVAFVVVFVISFLLSGIIRFVSSLLFSYSKTLQKIQAKMAEWLNHFGSYKEFFRFDSTNAMSSRFTEHNIRFLESSKSIFKVSSFFSPVIELVVVLMIGVSYVFYFQSEYFLQILAALGFMVKPIRNISEQYSRWSRVQGALYEVNKLMSEDIRQDSSARTHLKITSENLNILSMSLHASNRQFDFKDISLPRARMIKVMGDSGVGKSTFVEMLSGLYDDHETKEQFALMSQFSYLFNGTLKDNILYGSKVSDLKEPMWKDYFNRFELSKHSLDSVIDSKNFGLSGGEAQRVALMRTVLSGKKFLLLDEPFAALDSANTVSLSKLLYSLIEGEGLTVLMVSHDKNQLSPSDYVVWIDGHKKVHLIDKKIQEYPKVFQDWLNS